MLDDHSGDIGPWTNVNVLAVSVTGCELKKTLLCLLVDLRAQKFASLSAEAPVDSGLEFLSFGTVRVQSLSLGNWLRGGARRPRTPFRVSSAAAAGGSEDEPRVPGVRGMAACQLLIDQFEAYPEKGAAREGKAGERAPRTTWSRGTCISTSRRRCRLGSFRR